MSYELFLGDYAYSSWSLRGWLAFEAFGLKTQTHVISFSQGPVPEQLPQIAPARTVPALCCPDGTIITDSLAIAEELASRFPDAGHWPDTPAARAVARSLAAEMHAGFTALRSDCPMNLRRAYTNVLPSPEVLADLRRLDYIWAHARERCAPDGPWLCGAYSIADAFFAPVAARIAGYGLPVSTNAKSYVEAHLADPVFRRWRAMGLVHGPDLDRYAMPHETAPWPGPTPRPAQPLETGSACNTTCPYTGGPAKFLMQIDDRILGFSSAFYRDKSVADPDAWPALQAYLN